MNEEAKLKHYAKIFQQTYDRNMTIVK